MIRFNDEGRYIAIRRQWAKWIDSILPAEMLPFDQYLRAIDYQEVSDAAET